MNTTTSVARSASGPRARPSAITAIVTAGEAPTSNIAVSVAAAARAATRQVGRNRQERPQQIERDAQRQPRADHRHASETSHGRKARTQAADVEVKAGDHRNDHDGKAARDLKVARHDARDDVGERGTADEAERQVAGNARQLDELAEPADNRGGDERDTKRQRRVATMARADARDDEPRETYRDG